MAKKLHHSILQQNLQQRNLSMSASFLKSEGIHSEGLQEVLVPLLLSSEEASRISSKGQEVAVHDSSCNRQLFILF